MARDRAQYSLGELCEFRGGAAFKTHFQGNTSGEIPFVKVSDMNLPSNSVRILEANNWVSSCQLKELKAKPLPPGAVVFAKIGEALRQNRLRQVVRDTIVDNNMMGAVPLEEKVDPRFFYYALSQFDFSRIAQGTALPYLTITSLSGLSLEVPAIPEQRAIAHILGTLDDKIELNRRTNETLEAIARAIFKSWFVDFDPVRAKASNEPPESICRRLGLTPDLLALFPDRLVDSDLGKIPAGWEVGSILDQTKLLSGGTPKTSREEYWSGPIPWASAKDISQCGQAFLVTTERTITERGLEESATQLIPAYATVVVARGATTGRMAMLGREMAMNQTCYALETKTDTPFALHCRLHHEIDDLVHAAHGSVFDTITTNTFAASRIVLAPQPALKVFDAVAAPLFYRILVGMEESCTLSITRDTLLPKLLSGELHVPDAASVVNEITA